MANPKPHKYVPGYYIETLDATVLKVDRRYPTRPSADHVQVEHNCCGNKVTYTASQINTKIGRVYRGDVIYPNLCRVCACDLSRRRDNPRMSPAFRHGPTWSPVSDTLAGSYYGDGVVVSSLLQST